MTILSKSRIISFRQCPKRLWLEIHHPELKEESAGTVASFRVGHQVGDVAKRIYDPAGHGIEVNAQRDGYARAFAQSAQLLAEPNRPVFEAGLRAAGALAFADVMLPDLAHGAPGWRMVEVKSATQIRDYHREDIAVQSFVAQSAGVNLKSVSLALIDSSWVYPGDDDYQGLLVETDLTDEAFARTEEVRGWIAEAQQVASLSTEPTIATGPQCHDPFDCSFCNYCNRDKTQPEFPVDWLPGFSTKKCEKLADEGVNDLRNVPDGSLNTKQLLVKEHTLANTIYFAAAGAAADLAPHGFPAYFLDFETVQFAVPIWKGTRPYQQIPFQFSLHKLTSPSQLSHSAFLDLSGGDPTETFARTLIDACGETGPVYVYNAAFEVTRIKELALKFPDLASPLEAIIFRVVDLLTIARNRYYHPSQKGSWSLKAVLPAAVPELTYEALEGVKDGTMAMEAYWEALQPGTTPQRKSEIERQIQAYCRLDTFAMVRLWQFFNGRHDPPLADSL